MNILDMQPFLLNFVAGYDTESPVHTELQEYC